MGGPIVVTGSHGYIGWNLQKALDSKDIRHVDIDFKNRATDDIRDPARMKKVTIGASQIVHLAALSDVQSSIEDPKPSHETNITGTLNILEAARKNDVGSFIFSSSLAAKDIQNPLGFQKRVGEECCELYSKLYGIRTIVLRLSNVYGGQNFIQNKDTVISVFTKQLLKSRPLDVFGGDQTRDFVHISDVVQGIQKAMESRKSHEIYEICSGKATSIRDLAHIFQKYDHSIEITYKKHRKGDIMHSIGDPSLAEEHLRYMPEKELETGITEMVVILKNR